jgi:CHAD domain-containing protein
VLGKRSLEVIETLKILQDHLGDMNDAQVATQILGEFIVTWEKNSQTAAIAERDSIEEVVSYLAARHSERHQLLLTFTNTWDTHFNNKDFRRRLAQSVAVL